MNVKSKLEIKIQINELQKCIDYLLSNGNIHSKDHFMLECSILTIKELLEEDE